MGVFFSLLLAVPVLLLLLHHAATRRQWQSGGRLQWILGCTALLFILLYIAALLMSRRDLYFSGYRSTSIIFLLMWLFAGLYGVLGMRPHTLPRRLLLAVCGMGWGLSMVLLVELLGDYRPQLIYNSPRYRLENTGRGVMNPCRLPELFVKNGLFERRYVLDSAWGICFRKSDIDSVKCINLSGSGLAVYIRVYPS